MKFYRIRKTVKNAWDNNFELLKTDREKYFQDIKDFLSKSRRKPYHFFRWHVSGDIMDQDYLENMKGIAKEYPDMNFLAFTKRYDLDFSDLPKNLAVVFSAWPDWPLPEHSLPVAWMQDGTETRYDEDKTLECPGNCETCGMCWSLKKIDRDVIFHKHN